jgi:hypothetical protein
MLDFILVTGDLVNFKPIFGKATVRVASGHLTGTGRATANGKTICIEGDEKKVRVFPGTYTSPPFVTPPGSGTASITSLARNQKAKRVKSNGKAVLLKGSSFTAQFQVTTPATKPPPPPPPIPDPMRVYSGTGTFTTFNKRAKGT